MYSKGTPMVFEGAPIIPHGHSKDSPRVFQWHSKGIASQAVLAAAAELVAKGGLRVGTVNFANEEITRGVTSTRLAIEIILLRNILVHCMHTCALSILPLATATVLEERRLQQPTGPKHS